MSTELSIYVDGSYGLHVNENLKGGISIYFPDYNGIDAAISITQGSSVNLDNQGLECLAVYIALFISKDIGNVVIHSDSQHAVMSLSDWYERLQKSGWMTKKNKRVAHADILIGCAEIIIERDKMHYKTHIKHVVAHSDILGNDIADKYAYSAMKLDWNQLKDSVQRMFLEFSPDICNTVAKDISIKEFQREVYNRYSKGRNKNETTSVFDASPGWYDISEHTMETTIVPLSRPTSPTDVEREHIVAEILDKDSHTYLFYSCLHCLNSVTIQYPKNTVKKALKELTDTGQYLVGCTLCKDCISRIRGNIDYNHIVEASHEYSIAIKKLPISNFIFERMPIYDCIKDIYNCIPTTIMENGKMKFTPIDAILKMCNKHCIVRSVDTGNREILPYLRFGFLM